MREVMKYKTDKTYKWNSEIVIKIHKDVCLIPPGITSDPKTLSWTTVLKVSASGYTNCVCQVFSDVWWYPFNYDTLYL